MTTPTLSVDQSTIRQRYGFDVGDVLRVDGEGTTTFLFRYIGADGSITVTTVGTGTWRSFRPEWCYLARVPGRRPNTMVDGKLPVERKGLRARWLLDHGLVCRRSREPCGTDEQRADDDV